MTDEFVKKRVAITGATWNPNMREMLAYVRVVLDPWTQELGPETLFAWDRRWTAGCVYEFEVRLGERGEVTNMRPSDVIVDRLQPHVVASMLITQRAAEAERARAKQSEKLKRDAKSLAALDPLREAYRKTSLHMRPAFELALLDYIRKGGQ